MDLRSEVIVDHVINRDHYALVVDEVFSLATDVICLAVVPPEAEEI